MLTKGKFLVSFEVPGHTKDYTEEMVIPYRTEELNPLPPLPPPRNKQKSSSLRIHKAKVKRDITIIDIIPLP